MLKRIFFVIAVSVLALATIGCACNGGTVNPTPTASVKPISTPAAAVSTPAASAGASPDAMSSPGVGDGTGTGTGTGTGAIANFKEGTEVEPEDVPEIRTAVETKYSGATIKTIRHALKDGKQLYEVEIETNGTTQKVYVQPDGTMLEENNTAS